MPHDRALRVNIEKSNLSPHQAWAIYQGPDAFLILRSRHDYPTSADALRAGYAAAEEIARRLKTKVLRHNTLLD